MSRADSNGAARTVLAGALKHRARQAVAKRARLGSRWSC